LRDEGLLQSALARPKNLLAYTEPKPDVAALAASYAFGITHNHPFIDGNKRTAYVAMRLFLQLNDKDIEAEQEDKYQTFIKLAEGSLTEEELVNWIREHLK
jgi:death-on-curing protein